MDKTAELLESVKPLLIQWRRQLHQMAELSGCETETAAFVASELNKMPGMRLTFPCKTGVVGILEPGCGTFSPAFRADLDALPISEETGLPFSSKNKGVMHACGHDGNAAMLLGAAWVLSRSALPNCRQIRFLFEPGEETPPGFSSAIVANGAVDGMDELYAVHVDAFTPVNSIRFCPGYAMAASARFDICILGNGGHAAFPHQCSDIVYASSELVCKLQGIPSRMIDPVQPCVITVTSIKSDPVDTFNVIPSSMHLKGTIRCLQDALLDTVIPMVEKMAAATAQAYGAKSTFCYEKGYASVYNDPRLCAKAQKTTAALFGESAAITESPVMGGEAFSVYGKYLPSCYMKVGTMVETGTPYPHHHCKFDINESGLWAGTALMVRLAKEQ